MAQVNSIQPWRQERINVNVETGEIITAKQAKKYHKYISKTTKYENDGNYNIKREIYLYGRSNQTELW